MSFFICHIHNYTEYNEEWNVFSAHTLGAVGSRHCGARGAVVDFLPEPGFELTTLGYLKFQVQRSIHYNLHPCPASNHGYVILVLFLDYCIIYYQFEGDFIFSFYLYKF